MEGGEQLLKIKLMLIIYFLALNAFKYKSLKTLSKIIKRIYYFSPQLDV